MIPHLSDYVSSFSRQARRTVDSVLSESTIEKAQIGNLIKKVGSFASAADYIPSYVNSLSSLQREPMIDLFRDMDLRIKTNFDIVNSLSLLRASMESIFSGEVEKIEKDIIYLESFINNYSFISGEDDLYNDSLIENFDNDKNSYIYENSNLQIPDRDGNKFLPKERAFIDKATNSLKFSSSFEESLINLEKSNIKELNYYTNFSEEYISSNTGIDNVFNNSSAKTWNMTVKTPFVVTGSLFDREEFKLFQNGVSVDSSAQIAVEIIFNTYVQASRLRVLPNTTKGLYITQVVLETDSSNTQTNSSTNQFKKIPILSSAVYAEKSLDIDFGGSNHVRSIIIFFSQKEYAKTRIAPLQSELNSKLVNQIAKAVRVERKKNHDKLQDMVIKFFIKDYARDYIIRNKKLYNYDYTNYYPTDLSKKSVGVLKEIKRNNYYSDLDSYNKFRNTSLLSNVVFSVISYSLGSRLRSLVKSTYIESNLKDTVKNAAMYRSGGLVPLGDSNIGNRNAHFVEESYNSFNQLDAATLLNNIETPGLYEYMFSLKNIALFTVSETTSSTSPGRRSVFVSKKMPIEGMPLKTKMMAEYFPELLRSQFNSGFDSTSVEFSVSIVDNPSQETDWIPLIPFNDTYIRSEYLFLDIAGKGSLRFIPNQESVILYEDGIRRDYGTYSLSGKNISVLNFNKNKNYFISYTPFNIANYKEINLFSKAMSTPILVTASSSGYSGEIFDGTGTSNSIQLSHLPYIDQSKFVNASYSAINGTIATSKSTSGNFDYSSYSPIKIIMADGTIATNITNYLLTDAQNPYFYSTDSVLFTHSGRYIMFNKPITQSFRVLYQYIPEVFRYRIILRNLNGTQDNYSVDRLLFKFSINKDNTFVNNFIKFDNKYKDKLI